MIELTVTIHLRDNIPQGREVKWKVWDEEIDVLVHIDEPIVTDKPEILGIFRDASGDGDWEEIKYDVLPDSVEKDIEDELFDYLTTLSEVA